MKILISVDTLGVGGVEWNSIEVGAKLRDVYGHDVVLFGTPGPMVRLAQEKRIRFVPAPSPRVHPSPARMRVLCDVVRRERPDLIQAWDFHAGLDAFYSAHLVMRVPLHISHGNMDIERVLPKHVPTTFMTPELVDRAKACGRNPVGLFLPPVDLERNSPGAVDPEPFRRQCDVQPGEITIVTVSRLAKWMKLDSLRRTIDAVRLIGRSIPIKLILVGDGDARPELEEMARRTNAELGRTAVIFTGALLDPRPAYATADMVIGMGGSSLRAMAFGKPVIVVGKGSFSAPFTPETASTFYYTGMYGHADASLGCDKLAAAIRGFTERGRELSSLGAFSLDFVRRHHSLDAATTSLHEFSNRAVTHAPPIESGLRDGLRTAGVMAAGRFVPDVIRRYTKKHEAAKLAKLQSLPS